MPRSSPKVARLLLATSTEFTEAHDHFVSVPVIAGPQPCLIELRQPGGAVKLIDVLTMVPGHVRTEIVVDPIYAAYLRLIRRTCDRDIRLASLDPKNIQLASKTCDEPPFACAAQTELRQRVFQTIENSALTNKQQVANLVHNATRDVFWHPVNIRIGPVAARRRRPWLILARWALWENERLSWDHRLERHYADIGKRLLANKSQHKEAFRKMCASLGLKKGELSPTQRAISAWVPRGEIIP